MSNIIRQLRCKHHWETLDRFPYKFGCKKCGRYKKVYTWDYPEWKFKRKHKGDTFE